MSPPDATTFIDDGVFPNNAALALLCYRRAFGSQQVDLATEFEQRFNRNDWPAAWRSGIFDRHHYHSTAHEVLGVFRGSASLQFGGESGEVIPFSPGDAVIIPAGVAHKAVSASADFCVVGAYPAGQRWDTCFGEPGERPAADRRINALELPATDPLFGRDGPLVTCWA